MQKLFKRCALVLTAMIAILCMAAFAVACTDGGDNGDPSNGGDKTEYATTTFTVTVNDENGNPVDPSIGMYYGEPYTIKVQFCSVLPSGELGECAAIVDLNSEAKVTFNLENIKSLMHNSIEQGATKMELHVHGVAELGYEATYAQYEFDKVPLEIVVTLKLAA